jgi:DNA-binding NarL/FixJ family response regulator
MNQDIRIVIADDHQLFLDGLRAAVEREPRLRVVGEANHGATAWRLIEECRPDVAILDINMRESEDGARRAVGFDLARTIQQRALPVGVIFLTWEDDPAVLDLALGLGAQGYVLKESATVEIVAGIRAIAAGKLYVSPALTACLLARRSRPTPFPGWSELTAREREVLCLIAAGKSGKEIAEELRISEGTADNYRSHISRKLGLHFTYSLLKFAIAHRDEIAVLCREEADPRATLRPN